MPTARSRDGLDLHYAVHDHTDPWADRPVLLLQHGFGRTAAFWYHMAPYLSRHFRVVCPTLRGFGESGGEFDRDRPIRLEDCVDDLRAIVDALGARTVHVAGESFGGILGMAFAATHPERVRTLSLMTAPVRIGADVQRTFAFGHASWDAAIEALGVYGWSVRANAATRFPPGTDPKLIDWYARETGRSRVGSMVALVRLLATADAAPLLAGIRAPVLGLYPSDGAVATAQQQAELRAGIRDLRIVHLPTTYHMVWVLHPVACARHVAHFAAAHDGFACVD